MYKIHKDVIPFPLRNIFNKNKDVHQHNTRHRNDFIIPHHKCNLVHQSFLSTGPKIWMNIPTAYKNLNYRKFCKGMKRHYVDSYI